MCQYWKFRPSRVCTTTSEDLRLALAPRPRDTPSRRAPRRCRCRCETKRPRRLRRQRLVDVRDEVARIAEESPHRVLLVERPQRPGRLVRGGNRTAASDQPLPEAARVRQRMPRFRRGGERTGEQRGRDCPIPIHQQTDSSTDMVPPPAGRSLTQVGYSVEVEDLRDGSRTSSSCRTRAGRRRRSQVRCRQSRRPPAVEARSAAASARHAPSAARPRSGRA